MEAGSVPGSGEESVLGGSFRCVTSGETVHKKDALVINQPLNYDNQIHITDLDDENTIKVKKCSPSSSR